MVLASLFDRYGGLLIARLDRIMLQRPPQDPKHPSLRFPLEEAVTSTLRIGQHYADEFARLVRFAVTIQFAGIPQDSNRSASCASASLSIPTCLAPMHSGFFVAVNC